MAGFLAASSVKQGRQLASQQQQNSSISELKFEG
jgi:hypothetical protein